MIIKCHFCNLATENTDGDVWECPGYHLAYSANQNGIYLYTGFMDESNYRYKLVGSQLSNSTTLISYIPPSGKSNRRSEVEEEWKIPRYIPLIIGADGKAQIKNMIDKISKLMVFT